MSNENRFCIILYAANIIARVNSPKMNSFCLQNKCAMFRVTSEDFNVGRCGLAGDDVLFNFMKITKSE